MTDKSKQLSAHFDANQWAKAVKYLMLCAFGSEVAISSDYSKDKTKVVYNFADLRDGRQDHFEISMDELKNKTPGKQLKIIYERLSDMLIDFRPSFKEAEEGFFEDLAKISKEDHADERETDGETAPADQGDDREGVSGCAEGDQEGGSEVQK